MLPHEFPNAWEPTQPISMSRCDLYIVSLRLVSFKITILIRMKKSPMANLKHQTCRRNEGSLSRSSLLSVIWWIYMKQSVFTYIYVYIIHVYNMKFCGGSYQLSARHADAHSTPHLIFLFSVIQGGPCNYSVRQLSNHGWDYRMGRNPSPYTTKSIKWSLNMRVSVPRRMCMPHCLLWFKPA